MRTTTPSRPSITPCYGSPAEVATYAGLSVTTVRRLVKTGALRGFLIGRRLVIPFAEVDRLVVKSPAAATLQSGPDATTRSSLEQSAVATADWVDPAPTPTVEAPDPPVSPPAPMAPQATEEPPEIPGGVAGTRTVYNPFEVDRW